MLARAGMLAVTVTGTLTAGATAAAAAPSVVAQAAGGATTDLGPYVTGGGALSLTAILGFIAIKLARGELVVRDVKAVEAALLKVAGERQEEGAELRQIAAANAELTREALTVIVEARTELARHRSRPGGTA